MASQELEQHNIGHFGFSAVSTDQLGATGYTLVSIVCDKSGSTANFQNDMERTIKEVINACKLSPRADNLLVRVSSFENVHKEVHGFKMLESINLTDYDGILNPGGTTALFDAILDSVEATNNYARLLADQEFDVNAIIFIITDGDDNASTYGVKQILSALEATVQNETLENLITLLLGVNVASNHFKNYLEKIAKECKFTNFIPMEDASNKTLARLAAFVSKSISSQSQALGSGGPSKSINF